MRPHTLRITLVVGLLAAAIACNSPSTPAPTPSNPGVHVTQPERPVPPADPREVNLAKGVAQLLSKEHLRRPAIDDELSKKAFTEYLNRVDPGKTFLLEENIGELEVYASEMDDQILAGDLVLARLAAAVLAERQKVVAAVVASILEKPFDFSIKESVETDPEKTSFATSEAELADRWRKILKRQTLERIARMDGLVESLTKALAKAKTPEEKKSLSTALGKIPAAAERESKAREDMAKSYAGRFSRLAKLEPLEPAETFLNAVTSVFDPHTVYLAPAEQANFDIQMSGSLEGIGAVLSEDDHYIKVQEIVPGGASDRQGKLKAGDLIMAVTQEDKDAVDVADMRINQVVQMIRGPKGTVVTLTVKKPDDRVELISITRDVVQIEASYARGAVIDLGAKQPALGLVYLPSFYGNTRSQPGRTPQRNATGDVRTILDEFKKRNLRGVIVDLRGNGGGLLDQARDIAGMFIETGPIVQTRDGGGEEPQILVDRDPTVSFDGAVVVLVDRFSASASEIVAAALQDYGRAVVVGTTTHGKGTVQVLLDLTRMSTRQVKPLGVLKLTIQQFFRVNGGSTQFRGVVPDIELPDSAAHIESGERFLDNAIPYTEVAPLAVKKTSGAGWTLADLASKSATRVGKEAVFGKIKQLSALAKDRRARTTVSLHRKTWESQRDRDEKALEAANPKLAEGPERFSVKVIGGGGKSGSNDRIENWRKNLARDPWVAESLHILGDMLATSPSFSSTSTSTSTPTPTR